MELSAEGLELIKTAEGFRSHEYRDVAGFPTIGYGHRIGAGESFASPIDEPRAVAILLSDVREAERAVAHLVRVPVTQSQFDALVDFCFNLGAGRLAASTLLRELNDGHYAAAAAQLLSWDHSGGEVNPGLKARREAEFELWGRNPLASQSAA